MWYDIICWIAFAIWTTLMFIDIKTGRYVMKAHKEIKEQLETAIEVLDGIENATSCFNNEIDIAVELRDELKKLRNTKN